MESSGDASTKAQKATREGITPAVHQGLELIITAPAYKKLRSLKGKSFFLDGLEDATR